MCCDDVIEVKIWCECFGKGVVIECVCFVDVVVIVFDVEC